MSKVIDEFLSRYEKEFDFYYNLASNIETKLKNELSKHGVRSIVSSRAKSTARLDVKLEDRNRKKNYKSVEDIYNDIVDLAGVRVAIYFPGDMKSVEDIIKRNFKIHKTKRFPETDGKKKIGSYQKIFDGYSAVHFRVSINDESRYGNNHCVEIQVASVLMHAWSEVEHDLIYKPLQGDLSHEELMILDEINGLVLSGNIALERLQKAGQDRVNNENSDVFLNHYDLASFLLTKSDELNEDALDFRTLFSLLKLMNINKKQNVTELLEHINQDKGTIKRKNTAISIDLYINSLTERYQDKIIDVFTDRKVNDPEILYIIQKMTWDVIKSKDSTKIIDRIIESIHSLDFELDMFGRTYIDAEYHDVMDLSKFSDEELMTKFIEIRQFAEKMDFFEVTKKDIQKFIDTCQSLTLPS